MNQIESPDGIDIGIDVLNKHVAYIVKQVHSYEEAEDDEPGFSTSPCMMALVNMAVVALTTSGLRYLQSIIPQMSTHEMNNLQVFISTCFHLCSNIFLRLS